ncbi:hypothetical protein P7C70_g4298, partial [Phenoliferia sp. Uapishka_3]
MSLKQQLQVWSDALDAYEAQDFELSLQLFETIADESKILFNIGLVQATIGSHELAVESFEAAISLDSYLAVAYFQGGVSNFLLGRYQESRRDFDDAYSYLRSNLTIDYEQLGLKFRLYSCEILFNRGLSSMYMGEEAQGMADFTAAMKEKQTDEHGVIDEAFSDRGEGYTVFSIPVGVLYRPSANKLKNIKTRNYLGAAKLVAATDARDAFTGFTGSTLANGGAPPGVFGSDQNGVGTLSRAKTSAARIETTNQLGSAPPLRRNNTTLPTRTIPTRSASLGRSMTLPTRNRTGSGSQRKGAGLPTPPPSDEQRLPNGGDANRATTAYGGGDLIDSYLNNEDYRSTLPLPPLPKLPAALNGSAPTPEGQPADRVARWARQNAGAPPPQMTLSRNGSASETGGKGLMRKPSGMMMRSNTLGSPSPGRLGVGGGDYGSSSRGGGDLDDGFEGTLISEREMSKSISPDMLHEDFVERVRRKFESPTDLPMKYKDVDGAMVSIIDADDWESAIDEARENAKGRAEGKLEIWIE